MKQGDSSVREYNTLFLAGGLLDNHDHEMLVKMYRDGLRDDIRSAFGSTQFSTIDDIMQAALNVEEGERLSESDESSKRPKKKPRIEKNLEDDPEDEEPDADEDVTDVDVEDGESDESSKRPKKKPRTEKNLEDDPEDKEHDADKDETDADVEDCESDDTDSCDNGECSSPNTVDGSEDEADSKVQLKDYQEYLQNNHKSCSESSEESD